NRRQGDDAEGRCANLCHSDSPLWPRRRQLGANQPGDHGSMGKVWARAHQAVGMEWQGVPRRRGVTMADLTPERLAELRRIAEAATPGTRRRWSLCIGSGGALSVLSSCASFLQGFPFG